MHDRHGSAAAVHTVPESAGGKQAEVQQYHLDHVIETLEHTLALVRRARPTREPGRAALLLTSALTDLSGDLRVVRAAARAYLDQS